MSDSLFHKKIKNGYAEELLNDLTKSCAIEILDDEIPEWQKQIILKRLKAIEGDEENMLSEDNFFYNIDKINERI